MDGLYKNTFQLCKITNFVYTTHVSVLYYTLHEAEMVHLLHVRILTTSPASQPENEGSISVGVRDYLFCETSKHTLVSTQPPIQWVYGNPPLLLMWIGSEYDHSHPSDC